jgi:uncharacterized protein (DUF2132 family)
VEYFRITAETFGNPEKQPILIGIANQIDSLERQAQKSCCRYMTRVSWAKNHVTSDYVYKLIRKNFRERLDAIKNKYQLPRNLWTMMDNYTKTSFITVLEILPKPLDITTKPDRL